jgi:hypothetical protein
MDNSLFSATSYPRSFPVTVGKTGSATAADPAGHRLVAKTGSADRAAAIGYARQHGLG